MILGFKYIIDDPDKLQRKIVKELSWHTSKLYNILQYDILENKIDINLNNNINLISSEMYKEYSINWHKEWLHSQTFQQVILNVIQNYKSYVNAKKAYEEDSSKFKGEPRKPRYKGDDLQEIVFAKNAIRWEYGKIKLSLSKEMKEKYQVDSLRFSIPSRVRKLVDFSKVKMIRIRKIGEDIELNIIYEKEEKENDYQNIMAIDLGLNNIVACTNRDNANELLVSGREAKCVNSYVTQNSNFLQYNS